MTNIGTLYYMNKRTTNSSVKERIKRRTLAKNSLVYFCYNTISNLVNVVIKTWEALVLVQPSTLKQKHNIELDNSCLLICLAGDSSTTMYRL